MPDLLFFIIKLLVNIKAPVSLRQTVTISSTKASGKNAYKIFIIQFGLVKHASFHESFSPYIITRDALKWKFLVETEKEEIRPETEIMPIISTIAFMAMTVYLLY